MWGKLAIFLLRKVSFTTEQRNELVIHILDELKALPLHDIIYQNDGEILINGKVADIEKLKQLNGSAKAALSNQALHLIKEQVQYESFVGAAINAKNTPDLLFYRAALWWGQEVEKKLKLLARENQDISL